MSLLIFVADPIPIIIIIIIKKYLPLLCEPGLYCIYKHKYSYT